MNFPRRYLEGLWLILKGSATDIAEITVALIVLGWGLVMLFFPSNFNSPSYLAIRELPFPYVMWSLGTVLVGQVALIAIAFDLRRVRLATLFVEGSLLLFLVAGLIHSAGITTGVSTYTIGALLAGLCFVRRRVG